jgi:small-conductance mechanosensitive channel
VQKDDPAMWVQSRQYTGRVVAVSNARIFDEPVYNYTREFPYLWEELGVPIPYTADRARAERILLSAAEKHGVPVTELSAETLAELQRRYFLKPADVRPRVYLRLTDNWLEMTVRFVVRDHGIREQKDAMSREVLAGLEAAGIPIASATFEVVGFPPVRLADGVPRPARREAS